MKAIFLLLAVHSFILYQSEKNKKITANKEMQKIYATSLFVSKQYNSQIISSVYFNPDLIESNLNSENSWNNK